MVSIFYIFWCTFKLEFRMLTVKVLITNFQTIKPGEPYYSTFNQVTGRAFDEWLKGSEPVTVDYVAVDVKNKEQLQKVIFCSILQHCILLLFS